MTDARAAILARCDELERLARAAADREGGSSWRAAYRPNEAAWAWDVVTSPDRSWCGIVDGRTEETAAFVAAMDPAAVLALVAGARELCEIHGPREFDEHECAGCGLDRTGEAMNSLADCPTLAALARMLGVGDD